MSYKLTSTPFIFLFFLDRLGGGVEGSGAQELPDHDHVLKATGDCMGMFGMQFS
jgi:hypothetical protein